MSQEKGIEEGKGRHFICPTDYSYKDYCDALLRLETYVGRFTALSRSWRIPDYLLSNSALVFVGSEARGEGGYIEINELAIYTRTMPGATQLGKLVDGLFLRADKNVQLGGIEIRLSDDKDLAHWHIKSGSSNIRLVAPERVLYSSYLEGNPEVHSETRFSLIRQLRNKDDNRVLRKVKERLRGHRRITESGEQLFKRTNLKHFDFSTGEIFYDGELIHSVKLGPIREMQQALLRDEIVFLRDNEEQVAYELINWPNNTIKRLEAVKLHGHSGLSDEKFDVLTDNYKFFLWLYHCSQYAYSNSEKVIRMDAKELKQRCLDVSKICESRLIV